MRTTSYRVILRGPSARQNSLAPPGATWCHGEVTTNLADATGAAPDPDVVAQLVLEQAPHLARLPITPSPEAGSSNWVFRLGEDLAARLPRCDDYVDAIENEGLWLPRVSPVVSTPVPELLVAGQPSPTFPRPWAIVSWIDGNRLGDLEPAAQQSLAQDLGAFLQQLHRVDVSGMPAGAERWGYRCGEPVTDQIDAWADKVADALADLFDPAAVREAWRRVRNVPPSTATACLVHTDVSAENILVHPDGHLAGVIDFGSCGIGDPAVDLLYAWSFLDAPARQTLREAAAADEITWLRARAHAFVGPGLLTLHNYRSTVPERTARLIRLVRAIAAEVHVDLDRR